jgi:hypothetical protein
VACATGPIPQYTGSSSSSNSSRNSISRSSSNSSSSSVCSVEKNGLLCMLCRTAQDVNDMAQAIERSQMTAMRGKNLTGSLFFPIIFTRFISTQHNTYGDL